MQKVFLNKHGSRKWVCPECGHPNDICDDLAYENIADCHSCDYVDEFNPIENRNPECKQ